jgi:hypothetical protein
VLLRAVARIMRASNPNNNIKTTDSRLKVSILSHYWQIGNFLVRQYIISQSNYICYLKYARDNEKKQRLNGEKL